MESLSRPFHRRKLSNANSFSGKNAYDGVFSGHRPKFDGVPAVNVDEYREIFSSGQAASSIPVLDLSTLQESSDGSNLELGSTKPDYGKIFGGFRDEDIAVSYEELVARDKARFSMSTSQSSQDLGDDMSNQSFDALKQFNMSYNKISQRGKDGIDGTTHVTQLHVVPGFTCFIDESASQPKKETKKQKSSIANKVHSPDKQTSQTGVESKNKYLQDESLSDDKKTDLKSRDSKLSSSPSTSEIKNEEASQSKETEKQKSSVTNDVFLDKQSSETTVESKSKYHQDELLPEDKKINLKAHDSKVSSSLATSAIKNEAAFQSKKETEKQNSSVTNDVFHDKQTSQSGVESKSKNHQDELLSDDKKTDLKSDTSKVSSLNATSAIKNEEASESKKETEKQKSCVTEDDFLEKQTSKTAVESLHDDGIFKKFKADINLHSSKSSSSPHVTSTTNADNQKDYKNGSTATSSEKWKSDTNGPFSSTCFDDELDVNSVAFASTAALKKAIEKAQESIRIAMESVGRKKEGLKSYSNKSFKDSLKVKARVVNVSTIEKQKEKDDRIKEIFKARVANVSTSQVFSEFKDGEKLFGAKKVIIINEINEKIIESSENLEIPINSSHELKDNTIVSDFQEVGETKRSFEEVENDTNESLHKDNKKPNGFFVLESRENEIRDTKDTIEDENPIELKEDKDEVGQSEETSNLTLYQRVEDEKKLSHDLDQNGYEESYDESLGLLENTKQEILEQEQDDDVASEESDHEKEREVKEESDNESFKEEEDINENFYDVCEVEIIDFSSSDYDDAEDIEIINRIVIDTEEVDKSDNNVELSQEVDDVSDRSAQVIGEDTYIDNDVESSQEVDDVSKNSHQVTEEDKETINNTEEKVIFENISVDEIASKDNDELSHCGFADVDIGQKGPEEQSESCSDSIHCMEIEVKEYKESDETLEEEEEILKKEENKIQESKEERPETMFEMETGTSQEHNKESNEDIQKDETIKVVEKEKEEQKRIKEVTNEERERERNRVAVERAIREVRERAFNEARERAERAAVERANAMKASDVTSKIRAERAAVERATSEARQRALEKAMSQKKISEPKIQVNNVVQTTTSELHISNGTSTESALRSKAKLEKHNRIMERAAKALAEKEKRDLLVQKEQAERNRLAENLDADIKRWSIGKEGNLRALLSTLQYILGPESGWQSVSLTEIITTSAVKKAYRKATLCVHPDKLQQRGASIQQKYICEKVFDLLKAAWNRFNSEER